MEQGIPEAFFLDVDGTLLPIADSPETVVPTAAVCGLLNRLSAACDGALALVSGRPLRQVDLMFAPNRFVAAAQHGAERRDPGGMVVWSEAHLPALQAVGPRLRRLADSDPRLRLEDKGLAMALHYRRAPQLGDQLAIRMMTLLAPYSVLRLQPGKMVLEVCGAETGKGRAIEAYLRQPPFAGRRPIYIGDDLTDESGFEAVNARGGLSIKVGPEPSVAQERLADPAAVLAWLKSRLQGAESGDLARP
ncbi:MAG TPA: trehalose-phosphatase [Gammaproteobacteria bacterium]|jgi:trehalose 6-phosphate phosphatase|nr:trehalose-phosphatase [Gammaproteobacteria bacterium]